MINDLLAKWLLPALKRASGKQEDVPINKLSRASSDIFDGCDSINFRVLQLSNGTVIRMDSYRPMDDYVAQNRRPPPPNVFIVKDDETVQDAIVRMLAIHQLEK